MDKQANIPDLPPERWLDRLAHLLDPLEWFTQPRLYGIENIPAGGVLLVGNHTIYGILDVPFLLAELWKQRRITVRSLGEHAHYSIPIWRDALELCGMVRGSRANVRELMRERQNILVFPGGAREVNKRRGEKYRLMWKERIGFARLAIEFGYPIVPFAAVGAEEMLDVVIDEDFPPYAELAHLIEKLTHWPIQPVVRGVGASPIPRPERLYFWFGQPIDTERLSHRHEQDDTARRLRDEVKQVVEDGIGFLLTEREHDPHRRLRARRLGADNGESHKHLGLPPG